MKPISPKLKTALELGPVLLFLAVFLLFRNRTVHLWGQDYGGVVFATLVFIPVLAAATLALWRLTGRLSVMQVLTLVIVVVFGGLSVWLNDPRFFKMKPTLLYLLFAAILTVGMLRGKSWLATVLDGALPLQEAGWRILTWRMIGFFVVLALANEAVWRTQGDTAWVWFKTFGLTGAMVMFLLMNAGLIQRYGLPKE